MGRREYGLFFLVVGEVGREVSGGGGGGGGVLVP